MDASLSKFVTKANNLYKNVSIIEEQYFQIFECSYNIRSTVLLGELYDATIDASLSIFLGWKDRVLFWTTSLIIFFVYSYIYNL